jgi:mannose-6-phosphate isomerase
LLFKYLDAREDLSIQVHPNDELAKDIILLVMKCGIMQMMMPVLCRLQRKFKCHEYLKNLKK